MTNKRISKFQIIFMVEETLSNVVLSELRDIWYCSDFRRRMTST